ncbi:MAG TPA: hypothetical protein PK725_12570 [Rhodocyclaceae bacterium]|nr:hypothetical protein [Rhodocyclaceae bacterium]
MSTPTQIRAGDSASWTESLPDYPPAAGWQLTVRILWPTASAYAVAAVEEAGDYRVTIPATATEAWTAGRATLVRVLTRTVGEDEERVTLAPVVLHVQPNLATVAQLDGRTDAERALADAEAALAAYLASGRLHVAGYTINGRQMTFRSADELRAIIEHYKREVTAERARAAALNGYAPERIFTRF